MRKCKVNLESMKKETYYFHGIGTVYNYRNHETTLVSIIEHITTGKIETVNPPTGIVFIKEKITNRKCKLNDSDNQEVYYFHKFVECEGLTLAMLENVNSGKMELIEYIEDIIFLKGKK